MKVRVVVLTGFGINCDRETAAIFEMVGAKSERIHVNKFVKGERNLSEFHIMAISGGFSFGDHLGSGRLLGNRLRFGIRDQVKKFVENGGLIIGICNGFQVLVKMGLLPGDQLLSLKQTASLSLNDSGRYENRWVTLEFNQNSHCVWTKGIQRIRAPIRHGEGKFVTNDDKLLDKWSLTGQIVVRYVNPEDDFPSSSDDMLPYPISPNASMRNIAGICDPTGQIFGLMPHPEAYHSTWLGATWTRELGNHNHGEGEGVVIFRNAVNHILSLN